MCATDAINNDVISFWRSSSRWESTLQLIVLCRIESQKRNDCDGDGGGVSGRAVAYGMRWCQDGGNDDALNFSSIFLGRFDKRPNVREKRSKIEKKFHLHRLLMPKRLAVGDNGGGDITIR